MSHTTRSTLHFSPLLPLTPDWPALAQECSRAYFALYRVTQAVREGKADGRDYWQAHNRMQKAASVIASWGDPELYGRLLARESIMSDIEASQTRKSLYESQPPPTCPNVANNTPHASCCEQCRYELGI
jgi:hypothetical protein